MGHEESKLSKQLTVTALARQVGVRADTIRYYDKTGLLSPAARTAAAYRMYDDAAVDRLRFIQGGQRLGLRLREIRTLLDVRDSGRCPCATAEPLLHSRIAELDRELARLMALRTELMAMTDGLATDCPDPEPGTWLPQNSATTGETVPLTASPGNCSCCDDPLCDGACCGSGCC